MFTFFTSLNRNFFLILLTCLSTFLLILFLNLQNQPDRLLLIPILFVAASVALVLFFHPRWLPATIAAGLIAGQLIRLPITGGASNAVLLIDITTIGYAVIGGLRILLLRQRRQLPFSYLLLIGFIAWLLVSLVLGSASLDVKEQLIAAFYAIRLVLIFSILFVTYLLYTPTHHSAIINTFLIAGAVLVLLGFIQLIIFPNFAFMAQYGWDPHSGRLLSTYFDPNYFGMLLTFITSLCLSFLLIPQSHPHKIWLAALFLISLAALVLTFSRSSYLAFLIASFIIVTVRSWKLVLVTAVAFALVSMSVPRVKERIMGAFTVDATSVQRIESWQSTVKVIDSAPITGVGYNAFGPAQLRLGVREDLQGLATRGSDSTLLLFLATTGIIGLVLFLSFLAFLFAETSFIYRLTKDPWHKAVALSVLGILPAYIMHSQFVNGLTYPLLMVPFCILVGIQSRPTSTIE